jgi:hypothetical protein
LIDFFSCILSQKAPEKSGAFSFYENRKKVGKWVVIQLVNSAYPFDEIGRILLVFVFHSREID